MKKRTTGDILLDLEPLILELVEKQGLQWGDILGLVHIYLMVHCPNAREEYLDGTHPVFLYIPLDLTPEEAVSGVASRKRGLK